MFLITLLLAYALTATSIQGAQVIKPKISSLYEPRQKALNINQAMSEKAFLEFLTSFDQNNTTPKYFEIAKEKLQKFLSFKDSLGKPLININAMYYIGDYKRVYVLPSLLVYAQKRTPLEYALNTGKIKLAQILLESGASFTTIENSYFKPEDALSKTENLSPEQKKQFQAILNVFNAFKNRYSKTYEVINSKSYRTLHKHDHDIYLGTGYSYPVYLETNLDAIEMLEDIQKDLQKSDFTKFNDLQAWIYNNLSEKFKNNILLEQRIQQALKEFKNGSIGKLYSMVNIMQTIEDEIKPVTQDLERNKYLFSFCQKTIEEKRTTTFKDFTDKEIQQMINDLQQNNVSIYAEIIRYIYLHYYIYDLPHHDTLMYDLTHAYEDLKEGNKKPLKDLLFTQARVLQAVTDLSSFVSERALAMEKIFKKQSLIPIINFLTETKGEQKIAQEYKIFFKLSPYLKVKSDSANFDDDAWEDNPLANLFQEPQATKSTIIQHSKSLKLDDVD